MITLLIIGAVHSLYLSILVIAKRNKVTPDYILAVFLFVIFLVFGLLYSAFDGDDPYEMLYLIDISLLLAPIFFLYIKTITDSKYRFRWVYLFHFVLYVCSSIYYEDLFNTSSDETITKLLDPNTGFFAKPSAYVALQILELVIIPFYLIWSYILLVKHKKRIAQSYSYFQKVDYKWLKFFILIFGLVWLFTNGLLFLNSELQFIDEFEGVLIGFSISTLLIFYLGFLGFKQDAVFRSVKLTHKEKKAEGIGEESSETDIAEAIEEKKYAKTGLSKEKSEEFKNVVSDFMSHKKPYLNNKITLKELAEKLDIPAHHLSQIINEQFECNFFDFVNRYRVEEFKSKIHDSAHQQFSLLSIALDCGFNSKSSFNRIFKKFTNITPSEFANSVNV